MGSSLLSWVFFAQPVSAHLLAQLSEAVAKIASAIPATASSPQPGTLPTPTPTPVPTPVPKPRGGPFQFSLSGSLALGALSNSYVQDNPNNALGLISSSANQSSGQANLGMLAEMSRRSATSTFDIRVPLGISSQAGTTLGEGQVTYATPRYLIGYGARSFSQFGQLALGSTLQGLYFTVPTGASGDATILEGPALGVTGETVHAYGVTGRKILSNGVFEYGAFSNLAAPLTGEAQTALLGYATSRGKLQFSGEFAYQHRQTPDGPTSGIAGQVTANYGSGTDNAALTLRSVPQRFLSYGLGEVYSDKDAEVSLHHYRGRHSVNLDVGVDTSAFSGDVSKTRHDDASFSGPLGPMLYAVTLQDQLQAGSQPSIWTGTTALQLSLPLRSASILATSQLQRQTGEGIPPLSSFTLALSGNKYLHAYAVSAGYQLQRQMSEAGFSKVTQANIGLTRSFRKTSIGVNFQLQRTLSTFADALQRTSQLVLSRQLSPALSVQMNYGRQALTDARNPSANGHSRIFGIQFNSPFSIGNATAQGRVDPRLPATIVGRVQTEYANPSAAYASYASGGVGNVIVIMDGTQLQRTDLDGNFQFSFVSPGQHQIRVETSSVPRGLTVDMPVQTVTVQGGQVVQTTFLIGDFGGIAGHVFATDSNGAKIPLQNVVLRVDGGAYSQTDAQGNYGFGHLQSGDHVISVNLSTVPAFATFETKGLTRTVSVQKGELTTVNFDSEPLGSIAGTIVFASDMGKDTGRGVENAYVIAEPGEHAAIANTDGSFLLDDLPPGQYSLSVDPETIPEGLGAGPQSVDVSIGAQEHYQGVSFSVGHSEKKVTFSFVGSGVSSPSAPVIRISEPRLPQGGYTHVTVTAGKDAEQVSVSAFDQTIRLVFNQRASAWVGDLTVPADTKDGEYPVTAKADSGTQPEAAKVTVDSKQPIAILQMIPRTAKLGQVVTVRARFLVDVHAGDTIEWADRQQTVLPKPVAGRIFTFNLRLSLRPLHGELLTGHARLPISLM